MQHPLVSEKRMQDLFHDKYKVQIKDTEHGVPCVVMTDPTIFSSGRSCAWRPIWSLDKQEISCSKRTNRHHGIVLVAMVAQRRLFGPAYPLVLSPSRFSCLSIGITRARRLTSTRLVTILVPDGTIK